MPRGAQDAASAGCREAASIGLVFDEPVTLVGGGDLKPETLAAARRIAPTVVAADGGANHLREWRVSAAAVIGDMDSISDPEFWSTSGAKFHHEDEQDSTDLAKCLRLVRAPVFLAVGFLGNRLDHSIAAVGIVASRSTGPTILVGERDIAFAAPLEWEARIPAGSRISVLATRPVRVLASNGLHWPPDGLDLDFGETRGVSNLVEGGTVRIALDRRGALLVLEILHLEEVVRSLLHSAEVISR